MTDPILKGRLLNALRSVALAPAGLRLGAFPVAMARLVEMGLVEKRTHSARVRAQAWFLTEAGKKVIRRAGVGEG